MAYTASKLKNKTVEMADQASDSAGGILDKTAEKTENAFRTKDAAQGASENADDRKVEVAARYKSDDFKSTASQALNGAMVTAEGNWILKDLKFDNNRSDLRPGALTSLREIVATLNTRPDLKIEIQGHTDNSGDRDYNMALSERRARSVKAFLESQGIASSRMTIKGFGPDRPMFSNYSEEGFAQNRRVEIKPLN